MVLATLSNTPLYVWILLGFMIHNGYRSCFTRTRSLPRLALLPAFFLWLEYSSCRDLFGITAPHVLASLLGVALGLGCGVALTRNQQVRADRSRGWVQLPGDRITLGLIGVNFAFQYGLHVALHLRPEVPEGCSALALALLGAFSGLSLGRNLTYVFKYFSSGTTTPA